MKDPRFAQGLNETTEETDDGDLCLPVEVAAGAIDHELEMASPVAPTVDLVAHRVYITLSDGRRILVEGPTALPAVTGLVQGLLA